MGAAAVLLAGAAFGQTICLDPGHVSETSAGTRGRHSTEVHVVWELATRIKPLLEAKGVRVVMTKRSEGEVVTNRRRAEIANAAHADLMLRIHCDASSGTGFAVYYPTRTGTVHGVTGPDRRTLEITRPVAIRFHRALAREFHGVLRDNGLMSDDKTLIGSKQGALTGSIFSRVPTVLVETAVLTNPRDEDFVTSRKGMAKIARALADAALSAVGRTRLAYLSNLTNSSTDSPESRRRRRSVPGASSLCRGIASVTTAPGLVRTMWLPLCRPKIHPAFSNAARAASPLTTGSLAKL